MPQCFNHSVRNWPFAFPALWAVPIGVTGYTPSIAVFLDKRCFTVEWIATLCAEEMSRVPFCTASDNDLAFNRGLAALAPRREQLMEIKMAKESQASIAVFDLLPPELVDGDCSTSLASLDSS